MENSLLEYAKKELKLINFDQAGLYKPMLDFLEESAKICENDPNSMKAIVNMLNILIDRGLLSPITENDFEAEVYMQGDKEITIMRCTRYHYLYQMPDGKYYDDRATAFRNINNNGIIYLYQTMYNSKQEVTLPYIPIKEIKEIDIPIDDNKL